MKVAICRIEERDRSARLSRASELDAWSVQFGDQVLLYAANSKWNNVAAQAERGGLQLEEHPRDVKKGDLYLVVQKGRLFQQDYPDVAVLLDKGRYLAVELSTEEVKNIGAGEEPCYVVQPLKEDTVVFDVRPPPAARAAPVTWIQNLVNNVTISSFEATLTHLVSYPTRLSTSNHYSDAATWCRDQLDAIGYSTRLETISVENSSSHNVVAEKPGAGSDGRELVLVVAHLDSVNISGGPGASAPGADDNGSGSAALLEMAKVLQNHTAVHDLRFILFGGEEQGLHGSKQYVTSLPEAERNRIRAVLNMDMIGTLNTSDATVLLEGAAVSQSVVNDLESAAATYTSLIVQTSLNPFASDHVPFINAGLPAVLAIEGADSANSDIHTENDNLTHINYDLALEIMKMNVAFIATKLNRKGEIPMPNGSELLDCCNDLFDLLNPQFSGRYNFNGGATALAGTSAADVEAMPGEAALTNPIYNLEQPIYTRNQDSADLPSRLRFTLHIDIDGTDPLNVVSGTVAKGLYDVSNPPPHFIGRVSSNTLAGGVRSLVVEDFNFQWPNSTNTINRLEIALTGSILVVPTAEVTFVATEPDTRYGPYSATQESKYFRDIEFEVDREDGAIDAEPYNTLTHPDRPADLPEEALTLENTFARSGIRIIRSSSSNTINTSEAGGNSRWNEQELHDAMEDHWSAFTNKPQWKMWIFLAELADSDGLGGIMFDGDIDEPGGVDRQGTALFTLCPFFHTEGGGYIQANPPTAEAVQRELFFNLIHESGHAFNLAHSFQKSLGSPWASPSWMPVTSDTQALSWMNYPDGASPGSNATWFYDRFRFRFDDNENLFLRHAPARLVQMGNEAWFQNHGRVSRASLDRRLELVIRSRKTTIELGEPIILEIRLRNASGEGIMVHPNLNPSDGFIELAVTNPNGERRPFIPITHTRVQVKGQALDPDQRLYHAVNLTMGRFGFPFKEPGPYRIEASYTNLDRGTAAAIMQLWVRPPANYDDRRVISELFNARVGRVLYVGGSRAMEDVNDKLKWVGEHLDENHPAKFHIARVRSTPLANPFKRLKAYSNKVTLMDPDPGIVEQQLAPVLRNAETAADTIGHIEYRQLVDTYTQSALGVKKKNEAREAQDNLLVLFKKRDVIEPVIEDIEQRVKELN